MPVTGLYFISAQGADSPPLQTLVNGLNASYNPSPLPKWALSHRLFRETPTTTAHVLPTHKPSGQRYLQVLSLQHHAPRTYVAITAITSPSQTRAGTPASSQSAEMAAGEPATLIAIPSGAPSEEFVQLILSKFGPLWQQRQLLHVSNGHAFEVGDFRVRVGEVKQGGGGGNVGVSMGAICEIEWVGGDVEGGEGGTTEELEAGEVVIRAFWEGLGVKDARSVFTVPGLTLGEGSVRQWCEILRLRF